MNGLFLCRLLLALTLIWSGPTLGFGAEAEPETPVLQPEQETPPPKAPKTIAKKRPRHRSNRTASQNEQVQIGRDIVVRAGETAGEVVVLAGNAIIDGTVEGSLVVISGSATVNGHVNDDLVTVLGAVTLGPEAQIGHDAVIVGGPLHRSPGATIGGEQTVVLLNHTLPDFRGIQRWIAKGLFLARPLPPDVAWVWVIAGMFLLVYLAVTMIFPRPVRACIETLERQPMASFFMGFLLFVLLGPVLVLLAITVAGIAAIPFVLCALAAAALLGKVAVYSYAGQQVGRQFHLSNPGVPLLLLLGVIVFYIIYMVPFLGFAVWGIVTVIGIGSVLLAAFGTFRREREPIYAGAPAFSAGPGFVPSSSTAGLAAVPPMLAPTDLALLPRVGFWRRLTATFLDFVLLGALIHFTGALFVILWAAYHVAMWTWKGTTIGGIVLNIKIVRADGQPIDFAVALVRSLSSFFSAFVLFLGFFWAGWDRERQAWHDKIAGTIVVKVPRGMSLI